MAKSFHLLRTAICIMYRGNERRDVKIPISSTGGVIVPEALDLLLEKMRDEDDPYVQEKLLTCLERSEQAMRTRCVSF